MDDFIKTVDDDIIDNKYSSETEHKTQMNQHEDHSPDEEYINDETLN